MATPRKPKTPGNRPARVRPTSPPRTAKPATATRPSTAKSAPKETGVQRLHVRIAHSGLCSRRAAEKMILEGRVEVNGQIVREMGIKVLPTDVVSVDGRSASDAPLYTLVLNKPTGCVTTLFDPQRRPTIVRYLPDLGVQLKPVGRLDMDTEGLLIVTNDGALAQRLAHPRHGIDKEYLAIVAGIPEDKALNELRNGVFVEGRRTAKAIVEVIHAERTTQTTSLKMVIHEGRKRQIRLMCEAVGHPIKSLRRVRIGPLSVRGLRAGECRMLGQKEVNDLRRIVGLAP